ncbi:RsfA family transcriptional regulator [bacterium LRH843]|nr:RsfA family transcriptional regulator [bacterium LRH843]
MTTIRQDAWSADEDLILAEVVLRHIREGSTQLAAFEEVGERLSRTSAACGFRWNSTIRRKYESAISLAKKQRTKDKKTKNSNEIMVSDWDEEQSEELLVGNELNRSPENETEILTMEKVVTFLKEYHENRQDENLLELKELLNENERLKLELAKEREKNQVMAEDYRSLLSIMDRARKMSLYDHAAK